MSLAKILTLACLIALGGCIKTSVTEEDREAMRREFSHENYEKAMISSGRADELEEEKRKAAERGEDPR